MEDPADAQKQITDRFLELEDELGSFQLRIQGVPIWERIRYKTHQRILEESGSTGLFGSKVEYSGLKDAFRIFKAPHQILTKNAFFPKKADIAYFGHPRRKLHQDGLWWDIYCDPIIDELDHEQLYLETPYRAPYLIDQHFTPAKTKEIRYLDMIYLWAGFKIWSGMVRLTLDERDREQIRRIEDRIEEEFEVKLDLVSKVHRLLISRKALIPLFKKLLRKIDPKMVVLVASDGKGTLIEASKELDIPVLELQHGVINEHHLGYSYPGTERQKHSFPDRFLSFGEYWKEAIDWPIEKEKIIPVGFPYLDQEKEKYASTPKERQILFIGQGVVGPQLTRFAVELSEMKEFDHHIVYKLHPREYAMWRSEYPWLADSSIEVLDHDERSLYELFAASSIQVGVYSTGLFEGLRFGLSTFIVNLPGADTMRPLAERGVASMVGTPNELLEQLEKRNNTGGGDTSDFFLPNAMKNVRKVLDEFLKEKQ